MRLSWLAALFSMFPVALIAGPVTWDLVGVTLSDGGTASGSLVFDATTDSFSGIDITTTAGSMLGGAAYPYFCSSPCNGLPPSGGEILLLSAPSSSDLTGDEALRLTFFPALTDAGGTVSLTGLEASCRDSTCQGPTGPERTVSTGSLVATPEPASGLLLGTGATLLVIFRVRVSRRMSRFRSKRANSSASNRAS